MPPEYKAWFGVADDGWSVEVVLFEGEPRGEARFAQHDVAQFAVPVDLDVVAMFMAGRTDLLNAWMDRAVALHRPH
jgi:hypothetical protein